MGTLVVWKRESVRQRGHSGWGDVVRRLREERGWTQAQLAQRAGLDQSQVSKIEGGAREGATFETVGKIADALGVGTDYLRGRPVAGLPVADLADALIERMRAAQAGHDGAGPRRQATLNTDENDEAISTRRPGWSALATAG